jgi:hypothetical protein
MRLFCLSLVLLFSVAYGCGDESGDSNPSNPVDEESLGDSGDEASGDEDLDASESNPDEVSDPEPGPVIWTGPKITFEKENFADPGEAANQDAITESVILTRGGRDALYNVVLEERAGNQSPMGTGWAQGTTANLEGLEFKPLKAAANDQLKRLPGKSFVLHLVEDDIYIDVTFISWTSGNSSGGGFSYERSTPTE